MDFTIDLLPDPLPIGDRKAQPLLEVCREWNSLARLEDEAEIDRGLFGPLLAP